VSARIFHRVLAEGWVSLATVAAGDGPLARLPWVCSGGSFCNRLLERDLTELTSRRPARTFFSQVISTTDAGLAFWTGTICPNIVIGLATYYLIKESKRSII